MLPPGCPRAQTATTDALLPARLLQGKDVIPFIESLVVGDVAGLADGTGSLSVMTNERGGIIDDTVITKVRCCGFLTASLALEKSQHWPTFAHAPAILPPSR